MSPETIKSYKQFKPSGTFDAIIIGSGMSGLTCAAILAKAGKRPLVLEQHYTAGGYTHVFKRNGYEWDVGIHYIGGINEPDSFLSRLFNYLTGGELQWEDMGEVYDRIYFGDDSYELRKGRKNLAAGLKTYFPEEAGAIEAYFDLVRQASRASQTYFAEKALPPVMAKVAGKRMRREFLRFAEQTTLSVLEELTSNRKLIGVLTAQYGDYGLPPGESSFAMHAMLVNHYLRGAGFPVGGSARIAETVAATLAPAGGLILTNADVAEIILDGKKATSVRLADGQEFHAPLIISSAGVFNTYHRLLPAEAAARFRLPEKLDNVKPSAAHFGLYVGFQESAAALCLQKANYWVYPADGYDHDANIARYLANPAGDFPLVFISFPSAKDPDWENRYPGRATVEVITLAPYEWVAAWEESRWKRRGDDYEAFKEDISQRLLQVLYRHEPQLAGKVDHYELSTPLSTRHFANYPAGEIYGLNHDPDRFAQDFLRPHTPIKNLYLTGQDVTTAGVAGALLSGVLTMSAIDKKDHLTQILKASPK